MELQEDPEEESHSVAGEGKLALNSPVTQVIKVGPSTEQSGLEKEPVPPTGGAGDRSGCDVPDWVHLFGL